MGKHVSLLQSVPDNFGMGHNVCVSVVVRLSTMFLGESWPTKRSSKRPVWHQIEKLGGRGGVGGLALICLVDISSSQITNTDAQTSRTHLKLLHQLINADIFPSSHNNHRVRIFLWIPFYALSLYWSSAGRRGRIRIQFHLHGLKSVSTSLKGPQPERMSLTLLCSWRQQLNVLVYRERIVVCQHVAAALRRQVCADGDIIKRHLLLTPLYSRTGPDRRTHAPLTRRFKCYAWRTSF